MTATTEDPRTAKSGRSSHNGEKDDFALLNLRSTPARLHIADGAYIDFAPFERRDFEAAHRRYFDLDALAFSPVIRYRSAVSSHPEWTLYAFLLIWGVALAALMGIFFEWPMWGWVSLGVATVLLLGFFRLTIERGRIETRRYLLQQVNLAAVVFVAFFLPGLVAWYVGGFSANVQNLRDFHDLLTGKIEGADPTLAVAWIVLWLFVVMATLVPALLYFLFDRTQLGTLKTELLWNIARLERGLDSIDDIDAKYGRRIEETYGTDTTTNARLASGRRAPVVVATLLLSIGWTALLLRHGLSVNAGEVEPDFRLIDAWQPPASLAAFTFLGAYVFGIRLALRGHVRGDLQPKTYSRFSVRILVVVVLAWVLEALIDSPNGWWELAAFSIGIVPDEFIRFTRESGQRMIRGLPDLMPGSRTTSSAASASAPAPDGTVFAGSGGNGDEDSSDVDPNSDVGDGPDWPGNLSLTSLEGADIYDRVRLMDEGVNNVQALAKPDIVALLMRTRIPANRLLDWVNQAALVLRIGTPQRYWGGRNAARVLRELGVRGATEALEVLRRVKQGELVLADADEQLAAEFEALELSLTSDKTVSALLDWKEEPLIERPRAHEWADPTSDHPRSSVAAPADGSQEHTCVATLDVAVACHGPSPIRAEPPAQS